MKRVQVKNVKSKWTTGTGRHQPVFTPSEHEDILAELERREEQMRRRDITHIFSGLLICDVCGKRARRNKHGNPGNKRPVVVCRDFGAKHILWEYDEFFDTLASEIMREMERDKNGGGEEVETDKADVIRKAIEKNKSDRRKVQEGYKAGVFNSKEASTELRMLEKDLERLHADLENATAKRAARKDASAMMQTMDLRRVPEWLQTGNAREINHLLSVWLKEIRIGKKIKLVKR